MPKSKNKKKQKKEGCTVGNYIPPLNRSHNGPFLKPHQVKKFIPAPNIQQGGVNNTGQKGVTVIDTKNKGNQNVSLTYQPSDIAPFPPKIFDSEDFSKDLLDVGDSSNCGMNATSLDKNTTTSTNSNSTKLTPPKFTGKKIPVKMREDIVRKYGQNPAVNVKKQGHIQSNQLLKDCLSSDINTVVKDNIKTNIPIPRALMNNPIIRMPVQHIPRNPQNILRVSSPSGVPRSFLTRANQTVIEPQSSALDPQMNFIPIFQRPIFNEPITHSGIMGQPTFVPISQNNPIMGANTQTFGQNTFSTRYSPTDLYSDLPDEKKDDEQGERERSKSPDWQVNEKRVSAFDRLGPLAQPKTPKLTINLSFNKEQAVREVVDESSIPPTLPVKVYIPVHEREDVLHSTDDIVMKYVGIWPWAKTVAIRRTARSRGYRQKGSGRESSPVGYSPTAMMMLKEQMDEIYQRDNTFLSVSVTGYPASWTKEDVLDAMLDNLKGKSFVPCFIEFNDQECKFLVIRSRAALVAIHALDFLIQKDGVQLSISISHIALSVIQLDFIPRLILRKRLAMLHCDGTKLDLSTFTLQSDVSHFIYYPLHHLTNQLDLMKLQTDIIWSNLTDLNLSHNRLTTVEGFDLENRMPKLRHLDLSYNYIDAAMMLMCCRKLSLHSLKLEGNPLCHDYIDPQHYITVVKMMFPSLRTLDDLPIPLAGELPTVQRYYCPHNAATIIDNFLQLFIQLLDSDIDDRVLLYSMYDEGAIVTITYKPNIDSAFRYPRNLLVFSRSLLEGSREFAHGRVDVEKLLRRWPNFEHDPSSFTIDVMFHNETSTIFRLNGIVKLPADSLVDNEQLVAFSRTIHLSTSNGIEYKIHNEMIFWDKPTDESVKCAFGRTLVKRKPLSCKLELPPDEECKRKLITTFMKLTLLDEKPSIRCLELKDWDLRDALVYFMKLYKVDNLEPITSPT